MMNLRNAQWHRIPKDMEHHKQVRRTAILFTHEPTVADAKKEVERLTKSEPKHWRMIRFTHASNGKGEYLIDRIDVLSHVDARVHRLEFMQDKGSYTHKW